MSQKNRKMGRICAMLIKCVLDIANGIKRNISNKVVDKYQQKMEIKWSTGGKHETSQQCQHMWKTQN